jgi:hypothetical protein
MAAGRLSPRSRPLTVTMTARRSTTWPSVRACGVCGRERKIKRAAVDGDPDMCQACWKRDERSWRVCGRCGELRRTQGRDPADRSKVICQRCYRHARPAGICDDCGRTGQLARTGARGGSKLCGACADRARRPVRACGRCGQVKPVAVRRGADGTEDLCFYCYNKTPRRVCGGCGEVAAIQQRARDGAPDLCVRCYRPPIAHCSVCGRLKPCSYATTATPVCWSCKQRRVDVCAVCGEQRPIKAASAIGPLCDGCEWRRLRAKATCERCGQHRRPALHAGTGVLCGDCAGIPQTRICTGCGMEDITYDRGRCPACSLHARLEQWRIDGPPAVIARLDPHLATLERSPRPLSVLQWLAKPGGRTLAEIAAGTVELSHEALDAVDRGRSTDDLRAALVHASVLDGRDESLALMKRWTADTLGVLASGRDATTARAFATWKVGRELAARRARQGPDAFATRMPKHWIGAAVELTSWLHAQNRELVDLDQPLLDAWLADGPVNRARTVRPFVVWLERRDRHDLRIPTDRGGTPVIALDDRQRLAALRRLLHDDAIDPRLRLAGCLVALYAQPASRVVRLTRADLQLADAGPQIRLGRNMIALPLQLGDVARLTLATTTEGGWLFPGQKAGLPMHPAHLARRLSRLGVPVAPARPSALAALAHQIPAPVLADLLGFSAQTICNANADLKIDYARYVARRS